MIIHTTLRVLKKHINRAVENLKENPYESICKRCIMAEATLDMFPGCVVVFAYDDARIHPIETYDKNKDSPICAVLQVKNKNKVEKITGIADEEFVNVKPTSFQCVIQTFDTPVDYETGLNCLSKLRSQYSDKN